MNQVKTAKFPSLSFAVWSVLLAPRAILLELKLVRGGALVLGGGVVPLFADGALQPDDRSITHLSFSPTSNA
jgi:hypothetical protein